MPSLSLPVLAMVNLRLTVPPLVRFSSVMSMCVPGFSPSVLAMAPAGAAGTGAEVVVAGTGVVGAGCGGVAVADVLTVVVDACVVDVACSDFLHANANSRPRTTNEARFMNFLLAICSGMRAQSYRNVPLSSRIRKNVSFWRGQCFFLL